MLGLFFNSKPEKRIGSPPSEHLCVSPNENYSITQKKKKKKNGGQKKKQAMNCSFDPRAVGRFAKWLGTPHEVLEEKRGPSTSVPCTSGQGSSGIQVGPRVATVDGGSPAPLGNHGKLLFVGIYRGIIILGFLRRCRISSMALLWGNYGSGNLSLLLWPQRACERFKGAWFRVRKPKPCSEGIPAYPGMLWGVLFRGTSSGSVSKESLPLVVSVFFAARGPLGFLGSGFCLAKTDGN